MFGHPIPPYLAGAAAAHARRLRWFPWIGWSYVAIGVALLVEAALGPQPADPVLWFLGALFLLFSPFWLFIGRNARRVARGPEGGSGEPGP
jgi:hypothetical protein